MIPRPGMSLTSRSTCPDFAVFHSALVRYRAGPAAVKGEIGVCRTATIVIANEPLLTTDPASAKGSRCGGTYSSADGIGMYFETQCMPTAVCSPGKLPPPEPPG